MGCKKIKKMMLFDYGYRLITFRTFDSVMNLIHTFQKSNQLNIFDDNLKTGSKSYNAFFRLHLSTKLVKCQLLDIM
jgi:hypothetical protein